MCYTWAFGTVKLKKTTLLGNFLTLFLFKKTNEIDIKQNYNNIKLKNTIISWLTAISWNMSIFVKGIRSHMYTLNNIKILVYQQWCNKFKESLDGDIIFYA